MLMPKPLLSDAHPVCLYRHEDGSLSIWAADDYGESAVMLTPAQILELIGALAVAWIPEGEDGL
jgi:hypothetical protein